MKEADLPSLAYVNAMATLHLVQDLLEYIAQRDKEAFKRFADARIEQCETIIAKGARPDHDPFQEAHFVNVIRVRIRALRKVI